MIGAVITAYLIFFLQDSKPKLRHSTYHRAVGWLDQPINPINPTNSVGCRGSFIVIITQPFFLLVRKSSSARIWALGLNSISSMKHTCAGHFPSLSGRDTITNPTAIIEGQWATLGPQCSHPYIPDDHIIVRLQLPRREIGILHAERGQQSRIQ